MPGIHGAFGTGAPRLAWPVGASRLKGFTVNRLTVAALGLALVALLGVGPLLSAEAEEIGHYGTNRLVFAPVGQDSASDAKGQGIVEYRGGKEPDSRWRGSFRFKGLTPNRTYTVVVRGRLGVDEAREFSPLCTFDVKGNGNGSCFWYFSGLARLDVVQLRMGDENGAPVMQASRDDSLGSIETAPNRYSPSDELPESKTSKGKKDVRQDGAMARSD
jgi:hypothetical protein